ncbi:MAG TPA: hypothetical protein ENL10_03095 [Candidatus Cloacimonetes bacterium]|nr:hypothetical protein [Candidatus Cloacimonadota bacterium]
MNCDKLKFGALLVILSVCVMAAGWGMRLKGSTSHDLAGFTVIPYTVETNLGWASEHPYSSANEDEDDHDHREHHDGEDEYDHGHAEHHNGEDQDPNELENEHPYSVIYDDQDPNEPIDEYLSSITY